mgnify:CR=1 FL=1
MIRKNEEMMKSFEKELIGKKVMSDIGVPIGVIKESFVDSDSGEIQTVVLDPFQNINVEQFKHNEQGDIVLPAQDICSVQDMFVFEEKLD